MLSSTTCTGKGAENSLLICDLSMLHKYGKQALDSHLNNLGFNWQEMAVMMALQNDPSADQTLLSKLLQTDKGNITKLLGRMEEKKLITRTADPGDSRRKLILLTASGAARLPSLHEAMARWEQACFHGLTARQIKDFTEACRLIIANIKKQDRPS